MLVSASCQPVIADEACGGVIVCLSTEHGIVLGQDASERLAAARELQSAAAAYSAWFEGEVPERGLVILDARSADNAKFVGKSAWTINYDRSANRRPGSESGARGSEGAPFELSRGASEFDVTRPGVLAHEICHYHAARAFARARGRDAALPDMLDELAAISCETDASKAGRLSQFARTYANRAIPWQAFLDTRHPLKDSETLKALNRLAGGSKGAVGFDIEPGSPYGFRIASFYAQAAAFGAFLSARPCKDGQAIGGLLATYRPGEGLDRWLRSNGGGLCLPGSLDEFEKSFAQFMEANAGD